MADTIYTVAASPGNKLEESRIETPKPRGPSKHQQLAKLYALPTPLRTFPLPTFVPHNPLSLFHILYVWLSQAVKPEASHFDPLYQGWFSLETRSVHITDPRSIRGLWEQGFYGKGSLSRSEPSWLAREKTKRGNKEKLTSEEITRQRRAERQQTKWERARKEREAIDQRLSDEAEATLEKDHKLNGEPVLTPSQALVEETVKEVFDIGEEVALEKSHLVPPIGPMELLSLPNSRLDLDRYMNDPVALSFAECSAEDFDTESVRKLYAPPVGPLELLALPNSIPPYSLIEFGNPESKFHESSFTTNGHANAAGHLITTSLDNKTKSGLGNELKMNGHANVEDIEVVGGSDTNEDTVDGSIHSDTTETIGSPPNGSALANGSSIPPKIKRRKSVRFSPTVEKTTFIQTEPPSPGTSTTIIEEAPLIIRDMEHMQLTLEEAFFLSYALGALTILDPDTRRPVSNKDLFYWFRKTSYFPPQASPMLGPDDPFMINYVVYHHFRSLGWVLRAGIKFSVDYMLYTRGPVFTHAEFAVLILPSYSDPYWSGDAFLQNYVKGKETRTWTWLSCINRVITQVKKTLILCYVDIPKPLDKEEELKLGIDSILARYKVREIVMNRFVANRMRA